MRKLVLLIVLVMVLGVFGVVADSQDVGGDVPGFVEFTLLTTSVDYGSVAPGSSSADKPNEIQVSENNNVDFSIDIKLTENPNGLFDNIYFDLDSSGTYEDTEQLDEVLVFPITNEDGQFTVTLNSRLSVPPGFLPVTGATGTITYTITAIP